MLLPQKLCGLALCMILILSSASASAFDGQGTESDPYLIKNINDWNQLGNDVNDGGNDYHKKYFRLTADITINTYYLDQRIGIGIKGGGKPFRGTFDGNNHSITVSYGTSGSPIGSQYAAPFSVVDGATIKKLTIAGPVFTNVTVKYSSSPVTVDGVVSFIGTYGKSTFDAEDTGILFLGIDNTLYYPMNSAVIGAQRAFFQLLAHRGPVPL